MPRIRRIVLSALLSLGVILGIYTSVQGLSTGASRATIGSHPVNIYSRSFGDSSANVLTPYQGGQGQDGHGCHSDHPQADPEG
jgi:hypothetical protein